MAKAKLAEAYVELTQNDSRYMASLSRVRSSTQQTYTTMASLKSMAGSVFLGLAGAFGVSSITGVLSSVVTKTAENERAMVKLRAAVFATGQDAATSADGLDNFAQRIKDVTNTDADAIRSLIILGLNMGITGDKIEEFTKAAIGLSEATGVDATGAMELLAKASDGNFKAAQRLIPAVKLATTAQEKMDAIVKVANIGLKEREATMGTLSGATDRLRIATDDLEKAAGGAAGPALTYLANAAATYFKVLTAGSPEQGKFLLWLGKMRFAAEATAASLMGDSEGAKKAAGLADALGKAIGLVDSRNPDDKTVKHLKAIAEAAKAGKLGLAEYFEENARIAGQNPQVIAELKRREDAEKRAAAAKKNSAKFDAASRAALLRGQPKNYPAHGGAAAQRAAHDELQNVDEELSQLENTPSLDEKSRKAKVDALHKRRTQLVDYVMGEGDKLNRRYHAAAMRKQSEAHAQKISHEYDGAVNDLNNAPVYQPNTPEYAAAHPYAGRLAARNYVADVVGTQLRRDANQDANFQRDQGKQNAADFLGGGKPLDVKSSEILTVLKNIFAKLPVAAVYGA